ncbi:MAG: hypothetical protein J7L94_01370 [Caldisericaceae bacterium]|nr:hypothetical protein [Caldisericaceae bacterium]
MLDKLSNLAGLGNSADRPDKVNKKNNVRQADNSKASQKGVEKSSENSPKDAHVKISDSAKELMKLRAEAERYLKMIEEKETLSADKLAEIQNKLKSNQYLREEVIDKIVEKLINLPNFKNF